MFKGLLWDPFPFHSADLRELPPAEREEGRCLNLTNQDWFFKQRFVVRVTLQTLNYNLHFFLVHVHPHLQLYPLFLLTIK